MGGGNRRRLLPSEAHRLWRGGVHRPRERSPGSRDAEGRDVRRVGTTVGAFVRRSLACWNDPVAGRVSAGRQNTRAHRLVALCCRQIGGEFTTRVAFATPTL